mgnify:CR=1 FL=1
MEEKKGFFRRLVEGLTKTRDNIVSGIDSIFNGFSSIDDDFYEEIEEILVMGDLGINATTSIIEDLKKKVKEQNIKDPSECKKLLIQSIKDEMDVGETAYEFENRKSVVLVIGVKGGGKTTRPGQKGCPGCRRYVPGCRGRAAVRVGQTGRRGYDRGPGRVGSRLGSV